MAAKTTTSLIAMTKLLIGLGFLLMGAQLVTGGTDSGGDNARSGVAASQRLMYADRPKNKPGYGSNIQVKLPDWVLTGGVSDLVIERTLGDSDHFTLTGSDASSALTLLKYGFINSKTAWNDDLVAALAMGSKLEAHGWLHDLCESSGEPCENNSDYLSFLVASMDELQLQKSDEELEDEGIVRYTKEDPTICFEFWMHSTNPVEMGTPAEMASRDMPHTSHTTEMEPQLIKVQKCHSCVATYGEKACKGSTILRHTNGEDFPYSLVMTATEDMLWADNSYEDYNPVGLFWWAYVTTQEGLRRSGSFLSPDDSPFASKPSRKADLSHGKRLMGGTPATSGAVSGSAEELLIASIISLSFNSPAVLYCGPTMSANIVYDIKVIPDTQGTVTLTGFLEELQSSEGPVMLWNVVRSWNDLNIALVPKSISFRTSGGLETLTGPSVTDFLETCTEGIIDP